MFLERRVYICKTSKVISTSGNLAAVLDFYHTSTSHEIESTTAGKLDPENIDVAVGILTLCALQLEIVPEGPFHPTPLAVAGKRRKKPLPGEGLIVLTSVLTCDFSASK